MTHENRDDDERSYAYQLISRIIATYPKRLATSAQEKGAQELVEQEMTPLGLVSSYESFRFNRSLYANLMLHGLVGWMGTVLVSWNVWLGLSLHLLAWMSYLADNTRTFFLLRRLFPWHESQNLLLTAPATQPMRLRIVMLAHIDAAFTGWVFHPKMVQQAARKPPPGFQWTRYSIGLFLWSLVPLMVLDIMLLTSGWYSCMLFVFFSIPSFLVSALNFQVVLRNEIVPGANDNLTGVASLAVLASRLKDWKPNDVELVYVVTGAEEASLGGADALYSQHNDDWERTNTFILNLDTLCGGELFYLKEGDVWPCPMPAWIPGFVEDVKAGDERFAGVREFRVPVGGTDAIPFALGGYNNIALSCIDLDYGAPRHYHLPSDTPEHLNLDELMLSFDFAEHFVHKLNEHDLAGLKP